MPNLDGYEAVRQIREQETALGARRSSHVPIVALTANTMVGDRERCLAAGMDDYLSKPFKRRQLVVVLESYLAQASTPTTPTVGAATG